MTRIEFYFQAVFTMQKSPNQHMFYFQKVKYFEVFFRFLFFHYWVELEGLLRIFEKEKQFMSF